MHAESVHAESVHAEPEFSDARHTKVEPGDLVKNLNRIVRQVDGVTDLYDPRSSAVAAVAAAVTFMGGRAEMQPVVVSTSGEGLTVLLSLAVSASQPAAETCRRVFDAVQDFVVVNAPEDTLAVVRIRVSRIG